MGFFKKKKKDELDISFEADMYYDEMMNNGYNNNYYNQSPQDEIDYNNFVNNKFKYKKANKKVVSDEEYMRMIDEEYNEYVINKRQKRKTIIFSILIIYVFVLIIGIIYTPLYEKNGQKQGEIVTISTFEERENYNQLRVHYIELSNILLQVQAIDKKFSTSTSEDYFDLSTEYQNILPSLDKLLAKAKAVKVETKYSSIKTNVTDTYNDIAIYLQKMGTALNNSSSATYKEAVTWNNKTYEDYNKVKTNMYQFSEKVKVKEKEDFWNLIKK